MIVTDDELQASLQTFINNALTPAHGDVRVSVHGGVVTLEGRVATHSQRRALRDLLSATDGVNHVLYAIEVGATAAQPA